MKKLLFLCAFFLIGISSLLAQKSKAFVGSWTGESGVQYDISISNGQTMIQATDLSDGEVLEVSEIKVLSKKKLAFTLHTPSTDYSVHPVFILQNKTQLVIQLDDPTHARLSYEKK
jgi:hypothetical protein